MDGNDVRVMQTGPQQNLFAKSLTTCSRRSVPKADHGFLAHHCNFVLIVFWTEPQHLERNAIVVPSAHPEGGGATGGKWNLSFS